MELQRRAKEAYQQRRWRPFLGWVVLIVGLTTLSEIGRDRAAEWANQQIDTKAPEIVSRAEVFLASPWFSVTIWLVVGIVAVVLFLVVLFRVTQLRIEPLGIVTDMATGPSHTTLQEPIPETYHQQAGIAVELLDSAILGEESQEALDNLGIITGGRVLRLQVQIRAQGEATVSHLRLIIVGRTLYPIDFQPFLLGGGGGLVQTVYFELPDWLHWFTSPGEHDGQIEVLTGKVPRWDSWQCHLVI